MNEKFNPFEKVASGWENLTTKTAKKLYERTLETVRDDPETEEILDHLESLFHYTRTPEPKGHGVENINDAIAVSLSWKLALEEPLFKKFKSDFLINPTDLISKKHFADVWSGRKTEKINCLDFALMAILLGERVGYNLKPILCVESRRNVHFAVLDPQTGEKLAYFQDKFTTDEKFQRLMAQHKMRMVKEVPI